MVFKSNHFYTLIFWRHHVKRINLNQKCYTIATENKLSNMKVASAEDEPDSPSIQAYDALVNDKLKPFIANSNQIGGDLKTIVK